MVYSTLIIVIGFVAGLLSPVISFAVHWLVAKFIVVPLIGAQICFALNTVFSTDIFTLDFLTLFYETAALVGSLVFKSGPRTQSGRKE